MFLNKIELENYRPYYGNDNEFYLGFDKEDNLNFNVIYGNNANGKSSLLNAITWAFYGEELHDVKKRNNAIYNKIAREECKVNDTFVVRVKLELFDYDESGNKIPFHVERSVTYKKNKKIEPTIVEEKLKVLDFDGEIYDTQSKIDSNISNVMHKYFFFNGEQLEDYFDEGDLKDTVEMISQLNLISTVKTHLNHVRGLYTTEIDDNTEDTGPVNKKINEIENKIEELEEEQDTLDGEIDTLKNQIKRADDALEKFKKSRELVQRRKELWDENSQYESDLKFKRKDYNKRVMELYSIVSLFDVLYSVASNGEFEVSQQVLGKIYNKLLSEGKCLCGVDLNKSPKHKDHIKQLLENIDLTGDTLEKEDTVNSSLRSISGQLFTIKDKHELINKLRGEIYELNKKIEENNNELKDISDELKDFKGKDIQIATIEETRDDAIKQCRDKKERLREVANELIVKNKDLEDKISERDNILANKDHIENLKNELKFCESARNIVKDLDVKLKEDILTQIKNKISDQFINKGLSEDKFESVSIDEKYNVSMKDYLGDDILPGDLSGGEERVLALSFIVALNSISGFDLPLFIDAPVAGLDDDNTEIFMENLKKFTKDKQIIFLFIGDVYDKNIENLIKSHLNKKIELHKEQTYITRIIEHEEG